MTIVSDELFHCFRASSIFRGVPLYNIIVEWKFLTSALCLIRATQKMRLRRTQLN